MTPTQALTIERMQKRAEFLATAKGAACARGAVVVQALDRSAQREHVRCGFTATRKVGGAVVRYCGEKAKVFCATKDARTTPIAADCRRLGYAA